MAQVANNPSSFRGAPRTDLTADFRSLVESQGSTSRGLLPNPHQPPSSKTQIVQIWQKRRQAEAQWTSEATKLVNAADQLHTFVSSIRRPYLHLGARKDHRPADAAPREFGLDQEESNTSSSLASGSTQGPHSYAQLSHLSDAQKDEVDLHLKLVLERSIARLKELTAAEEKRRAAVPSTPTSALSRLFAPAASPTTLDSAEYSAQLGQHRDSMTAYIGASLKKAGERVGRMQESRIRALEEKAGKRRIIPSQKKTAATEKRQEAIPGSQSSFRATAGADTDLDNTQSSSAEELTQEQMQQFASESSALTKTLQSDLAAVENVTRTLNTIAELQTTLVQHLTIQNETITSLSDEAIDQRIEVEKGNTQLKQAKERSRSANRLLAAFLVGSGLGLLFLHVVD
ncbi:unnamed protein product [Sympodiomycopsis kandeliae]